MPIFQLPHWLSKISCIGLLVLPLVGCDGWSRASLPDWHAGELRVLEDAQDMTADAQFNHDLAVMFAAALRVKLVSVPVNVADAQKMLIEHRVHFAAIGHRSDVAVAGLIYAPPYQTMSEHLVYNNALDEAENFDDISKLRLAVIAGSAQETALLELKREHPNLRWEARRDVNVDDLLEEVSDGTVDATFVNQQQFFLAKNFHENLSAANFPDIAASHLAWAFAADGDADLRARATQFFTTIAKDGRLARLVDRYYGYTQRLAPLDASTFLEQIYITLPRYRKIFEEAERTSGLEWQLIAALAYQESHWNPLATSPTNVRGMMMLTEETADQLHVENRLDARLGTLAGARYLNMLREQLPEHIAEPDRTWMALAAYNQGTGHLEDARVLTQRMGMDADSWVNVKKWMPKLTQSKYLAGLKHGYARGGEAVILVENVRMYYDMIKRTQMSETLPEPAVSYHLSDKGSKPRIGHFSGSK